MRASSESGGSGLLQCSQVGRSSSMVATPLTALFPVDFVQQAVQNRREYHAGRDDEEKAGIERVQAGEQLATVRLRRIDPAHAAQEHRGVQERIAPRQV